MSTPPTANGSVYLLDNLGGLFEIKLTRENGKPSVCKVGQRESCATHHHIRHGQSLEGGYQIFVHENGVITFNEEGLTEEVPPADPENLPRGWRTGKIVALLPDLETANTVLREAKLKPWHTRLAPLTEMTLDILRQAAKSNGDPLPLFVLSEKFNLSTVPTN